MNEANSNNDSPSVVVRDGDYKIEIVEASTQPTREYQGCWPESCVTTKAAPLEFKSFKEAFGIPTRNKE